MLEERTKELLENLDRRMANVEQILPTLATREEMHAAIQAAVAPLATRVEMRKEGERTRRYMKVMTEALRDDIRLIAAGNLAIDERDARQHAEVTARLEAVEALEPRVAALEARRSRRTRLPNKE